MKRLERIVDLIDVVGLEKTYQRIELKAEKALVQLRYDFLNHKIQEKIEEGSSAYRSMIKMLKAADTVENAGESRKAFAKMLERSRKPHSINRN